MKKFLTVLIAVLMMASLAVTSYAANGSFQSSPSANRAPTIIEDSVNDPECISNGDDFGMVIISYADRVALADGGKEMEAAYDTIAKVDDLGQLSGVVSGIAEDAGVDTDELAVSDLFAMYHDECPVVEHDGVFTVMIKPQTTGNVVGVLTFDDGRWFEVKSSVDEEGVVTIETEKLYGIYAFVAHGGDVAADFDYTPIALTVLAGVLALVLIAVSFKKFEI